MNQCAGAEFEAADADLNAVWRVVKPRMDEIGAGASLLDAQRKWIAFRDAACASEADVYSGGSIAPLVAASCLARLTTRRTQDLREMMLP
ncbi:lysozyme inhibitor LprI family protein [Poseidonocella pacifica]|nr:lysozyme inhibitor LprI family protein [Poseidonocella pacifica]